MEKHRPHITKSSLKTVIAEVKVTITDNYVIPLTSKTDIQREDILWNFILWTLYFGYKNKKIKTYIGSTEGTFKRKW